MRPDVHEPPELIAVITRWPLPSRWTLFVELVMVSISPVPKLEPGPVSYFQFAELTIEPAAPAKLSLNTVVHPEGGGGTVVADAGRASPIPATKAAPRSAQMAASNVMVRR